MVATLPDLQKPHSLFLPLNPGDYKFDIWQYSLEKPYPNAHLLLNESERLRASRYHFEKHQRRFSTARAMLRVILAQYLNTEPQEIQFIENKYGKPSVNHISQIQFNLSHSKDLALLAIGYEYPVGVDLEYFSYRQLQGISHMMFSSKEIEGFSQVPSFMRSLSFFHIWAQKEALIKACGMGLSYPTQTFDVPHIPIKTHRVIDTLHNTTWQMHSFMPSIGCCAALCHHPDVIELRYKQLAIGSEDDIIE